MGVNHQYFMRQPYLMGVRVARKTNFIFVMCA